ncbi:hypothetical protein SAMN06273572_101908 [Monaibacterium marinum]|uniref:Uncharacterized protein n=1 Tax=Pontivivens marinum TaxID=1690039 RepID=A0A2C9CNZ9_9RHOB|nr:lipid A-modifier LpxR family protein [Monaibacterium marinum]SOH93054.1 hypothetical protein SAMN06273572_101908 [Monaibacterium marinum]
MISFIKAACLTAVVTLCPIAASADGFSLGGQIGSIGNFTNDAIGDGNDRWQSASYQRSWFYNGNVFAPDDAVEFRLRGQIVSPWTGQSDYVDPANPGAGAVSRNRSYGSALGFAAYAHTRTGAFETRIGAELLVIGGQTGLHSLQHQAHDLLGLDSSYDGRNRNDPRISNSIGGTVEVEFAANYSIQNEFRVRPYALAQAGSETTVRFGSDFIFGPLAVSDEHRWTRDAVTGMPLTAGMHDIEGFSFIAGADIGHAESSYLFPNNSQVDIEETRVRARLGVQAKIGMFSVMFGQTWMSEEFDGQDEAQRIGSLSIGFRI